MQTPFYNRRAFMISTGLVTGSALVSSVGLVSPAQAQSLSPTKTMRGGGNNYSPNAPIVERLGSGFWMSGNVNRTTTAAS